MENLAIGALLSILFTLNLILFVFNLLPLPPLDGSGIIPQLLSRERAVTYLNFIETTPFILIGLLVAWKLFDHVFVPVHLVFLNLLYPGAGFH
jgi:Zn-dependent protease